MQAGGISDAEMFRTFNMGIGMVVVVDPQDADAVLQLQPDSMILGSIISRTGVEFQEK